VRVGVEMSPQHQVVILTEGFKSEGAFG